MARNVVQPIIRKKKKRGGDDGHHGGAWKIAYADFVTAMMAFFLLMWLINVTSPEQKTGIAEYFNPITVSQRTAGSGGVLDGTSVSAPGPLVSPSSRITAIDPRLTFAPPNDNTSKSQATETTPDANQPNQGKPTEQDVQKAMKEREQKQFEAVADKLRKSIENLPELKGLLDNLIIDETPEGLRIQLVDRDERPMFALGSADPYDYTRQLLGLVTQAIADLPNKVSIRGHTDSLAYAPGKNYDNWNLSSERALASRRAMMEAGLAEARIEGVVGRADRDPLFPDHPEDPRNRRISIILLHEDAAGGTAGPAGATASAVEDQTTPPSSPDSGAAPPQAH
ncbi:MAG TPA: flagellar motor protein MotB [Candidatus Acidoferrum sp.]|nr:flagellar motor protein MotB [Candidatus Acidoferrum sp.]